MAKQSLFAAQLRAGDEKALQKLGQAIRRAGSIRGAARALGVNVRTFENWLQRGHHASIPAACDAADQAMH